MSARKVYTEEFKREAVRLAKERGNIAATARDLGISDNTLRDGNSGWTKLPTIPSLETAAHATRKWLPSSERMPALKRRTKS